jgi:hypothetical protein
MEEKDLRNPRRIVRLPQEGLRWHGELWGPTDLNLLLLDYTAMNLVPRTLVASTGHTACVI